MDVVGLLTTALVASKTYALQECSMCGCTKLVEYDAHKFQERSQDATRLRGLSCNIKGKIK
ncbi:hypothetical protein Plhal304r1_c066g0153711 [Plasmopara halstedii]